MSATLQEEMTSTSKRSGRTKGTSMLHLKGGKTDEDEDLELSYQDLPQSYFPCLDSKAGINRGFQSTEVPFRDTPRLRSFCTENDVSSLSVFQVAWALVLRCYLGNPSVCFAYSSCENPDAEEISKSPSTVSVCQVDFGATTSLLDVLKGAHKKHAQSSSPPSKFHASFHQPSIGSDLLPINTALVYREEKQRDWLGVVGPVDENYASNGLNNVRIANPRLLPLSAQHFTDKVSSLKYLFISALQKTTSSLVSTISNQPCRLSLH